MKSRLVATPRELEKTAGGPRSAEPSSSVQVVRRTLRILEALAASGHALTLTELAKRVELHPSTVLRILRTLAEDGYIASHSKPPTWTLGPAFLRLKTDAGVQNSLRDVARSFMSDLCARISQTVHLGEMLEHEVCYIEKVEPPDQGVVISSKVGERRPLHATSLGKALLAGMEPEALRKLVQQLDLVAMTPQTITSRRRLLKELDAVRDQGFSLDRYECNPLVQCVGAPIRDANGRVTAAISVSTLGLKIESPDFERIVKAAVETSGQISKALGFVR